MSNLSSRERQNSLCCDGDDSSSREISWKTEAKGWNSDLPFIAAWKVYLHQRVVLAGVALALLFFTVLSFGTLMTATLEWKGIPTYIIGVARGISAMVGTISYPKFLSRTSTLRAGLWFIWSQAQFANRNYEKLAETSMEFGPAFWDVWLLYGFQTVLNYLFRISASIWLCRGRSSERSAVVNGSDELCNGNDRLKSAGFLEDDFDIIYDGYNGCLLTLHLPSASD